MALEKKTGMTEERLEKLGETLELHITNTHKEGAGAVKPKLSFKDE